MMACNGVVYMTIKMMMRIITSIVWKALVTTTKLPPAYC